MTPDEPLHQTSPADGPDVADRALVSDPATHPARAVVDLDAVAANVAHLRTLAPAAQLMAVVKADAYGHGLLPVARAALAGGATWLGTAQAGEALALRAAGITAPRVLTWLYAPNAPFAALLAADVDLSVAAPWAVEAVAAAARAAGTTARVHVKVDTGLGRNGFTPDALEDVLPTLLGAQDEGVLDVVGVWSHLAFADEPGHPETDAQAAVFAAAAQRLQDAGAHLEVRHIANSAAVLTRPDLHLDLVRPGIAVYGLTPSPAIGSAAALGLRPAMRVEARLATVKQLPAGHGVSYSHLYRTTSATTTGVVPLGYADGVPRTVSGTADHAGAPVRVHGPAGPRDLRVVGRVCMDQVLLDLGPDATERPGDVVELFGSGADGGPTADDWAACAGTIGYEVVTRLGARVPRVHVGSAGRAAHPVVRTPSATTPSATTLSAGTTPAASDGASRTPLHQEVPA